MKVAVEEGFVIVLTDIMNVMPTVLSPAIATISIVNIINIGRDQ